MAYFIIYLIGCIITFFIIACHNDDNIKESNKFSILYIFLSWIFIIVYTIIFIIDFNFYQPSFKEIKEFFNNLFKRKK